MARQNLRVKSPVGKKKETDEESYQTICRRKQSGERRVQNKLELLTRTVGAPIAHRVERPQWRIWRLNQADSELAELQ